MNTTSFYKTEPENINKIACKLIEKCYNANYRTLVKVSEDKMQENINNYLWVFAQKSFVPHGSSQDPLPNIQPVLISTEINEINKPNLLVQINDFELYDSHYEKNLVIFSNEGDNIEKAKILFDKLTELSQKPQYYINNNNIWQQIDKFE